MDLFSVIFFKSSKPSFVKIVDFNDDGLAECVVEEISDEDKELAETARDNCPTGAIEIEEE